MAYEIKMINDIGKIEETIAKAPICRIGLVDGDEPYVIPVCFGYERGALYFHGSLKGRKVEILKTNNRVCFEIDVDIALEKAEDPCDWVMKGKSVIGSGRASILEDERDKIHALNVIMKHYSKGNFKFSESALASVLVVKIEILSITEKSITEKQIL